MLSRSFNTLSIRGTKLPVFVDGRSMSTVVKKWAIVLCIPEGKVLGDCLQLRDLEEVFVSA